MTTTELLNLMSSAAWTTVSNIADPEVLTNPEFCWFPPYDGTTGAFRDADLAFEYADGDGCVILHDGVIHVNPGHEFAMRFELASNGRLHRIE